MKRSFAGCAAAALLACAVATSGARASAYVPGYVPAYGMGSLKSEWLAGYNAAEGRDLQGINDLNLMNKTNTGLYRARFRQDRAKTSAGYTQWTQTDLLVGEAAKRGVTILPILINMPGEAYTPPATPEEIASFAEFARQAALRYGPTGRFWTTCGCPRRPIAAWEVWNEPNRSAYWAGTPSPSGYAQVLTAVRASLRRADPAARIIFAGLAQPTTVTTQNTDAAAFLRDAIAAAGPDGFDAISLHSYRGDAVYAVDTFVQTMVDTLKAAAGADPGGAPRQQVWLTEFGRTTSPDKPSTTTVNEQTTSEASQNTVLTAFLDRLLPRRAAYNLGPVLVYAMRDAANATEAYMRYGLRRTNPDDTDAGPKPFWMTYGKRGQAAAQLPLPVAR